MSVAGTVGANRSIPRSRSSPSSISCSNGYALTSTAGDSITIPKNGGVYDTEELKNKLQERHRLEPNRKDIIVAPEDGVHYEEVVRAMDLVVGEGYPDMSLGDAAAIL